MPPKPKPKGKRKSGEAAAAASASLEEAILQACRDNPDGLSTLELSRATEDAKVREMVADRFWLVGTGAGATAARAAHSSNPPSGAGVVCVSAPVAIAWYLFLGFWRRLVTRLWNFSQRAVPSVPDHMGELWGWW